LGQTRPVQTAPDVVVNTQATADYIARYVDAFGADALAGQVIGVYSHSTVGRDILMDVLHGLGAQVIELGRVDSFIPVDTEAVDPATRAQLRDWAAAHDLHAIMSMDGDGDRPLLTDAKGEVIPGDVLGQITGGYLGADIAVTPVSSNILGFAAAGLAPLMTRDSVLPLVVPMICAQAGGLDAVIAAQPARFTAADRLQEVPTEKSKAMIAGFDSDPALLGSFLARFDGVADRLDRTDGLRITLTDGRIVHLRPSGNAPECRFYAEADSVAAAQDTLAAGLLALRAQLDS